MKVLVQGVKVFIKGIEGGRERERAESEQSTSTTRLRTIARLCTKVLEVGVIARAGGSRSLTSVRGVRKQLSAKPPVRESRQRGSGPWRCAGACLPGPRLTRYNGGIRFIDFHAKTDALPSIEY
jgi:hypothetical protein